METRLRLRAPQQKGQRRGLGNNVNVDLMVLWCRDGAEQAECAGESPRTFYFLI